VDFDATGQILVTYSVFVKHLRKKNGNTIQRCIKKAYDPVREVLYNIFIEYVIQMKLVRLLKMCLNKTYIRFRVDKHLSDMFPIRNGWKKGMIYRRYSPT